MCNKIPNVSAQQDVMGNVTARKGRGDKVILLEAHLDEVGFIVSKVNPEEIQLVSIGNIDPAKVIESSITIVNRQNESVDTNMGENLTCPYFSGVSIGDWAFFKRNIIVNKQEITSPALDNRVGCASLLDVLRTIEANDSYTIVALFSTQHEQASELSLVSILTEINPDFAIIVDAAYAKPVQMENWTIPELGKGPALQLIGQGFIPNGQTIRLVEDTAKRRGLPYQFEIPDSKSGFTDAAKLPATLPYAVINIPVRDQHTAYSMANVSDITTTSSLVTAIVETIAAAK
jgi:endoglucanase